MGSPRQGVLLYPLKSRRRMQVRLDANRRCGYLPFAGRGTGPVREGEAMPASNSIGVIARRLLGAIAAVMFLTVILGCMSFSFEGRKSFIQHDDLTYSQSGKFEVPGAQEVE